MYAPLLLIDADDTLVDLAGEVYRIFQDDYGFTIPDWSGRNFFNMQTTVEGLTAEIIHEVLSRPGLWRDLTPNPGAVEALRKLQHWGTNAYILTSPYSGNPTCYADKMVNLTELFGDYWCDRIWIRSDKTIEDGMYLVDDKPNITGSNPTPMWKQIVFNQAYNQNHPSPLRLNSWETFETELDYLFR